jgi:Type IX secretion system membrane protein PorP/SprF
LALDKKSKSIFTVGVQWGKVGRSLKDVMKLVPGDLTAKRLDDPGTNAQSDDDLFKAGSSGTPGSGNSDKKTDFQDINVGFLLKSKVSKTTDYNIGVSVRHVTTPGDDFNFKNPTPDLNMRFTVHAQLNTELNKKMTLTPELYFSNLSPAMQMQAHAWVGYWLKQSDNIKLNGGLGYRVGDSAQLLLGLDYKDIKVQLGYDFTVSQLAQVNKRQGGFEIAAYYIGKIYKKPKVKPVILCPHL